MFSLKTKQKNNSVIVPVFFFTGLTSGSITGGQMKTDFSLWQVIHQHAHVLQYLYCEDHCYRSTSDLCKYAFSWPETFHGKMKRCRNLNSTWTESTTEARLSYWNISACQEPIFINIINNVSSASSMKWVSLFKAESSVHSLPFLSWTLQFHKARKKEEEGGRGEGGGGGGGGQRGQGLQWRRKRRENNVWQSRNLPLHWDMIGFSLVQEWPKNKNKKIQNGALKTKMREEEDFCWDVLLAAFCSIKPR